MTSSEIGNPPTSKLDYTQWFREIRMQSSPEGSRFNEPTALHDA